MRLSSHRWSLAYLALCSLPMLAAGCGGNGAGSDSSLSGIAAPAKKPVAPDFQNARFETPIIPSGTFVEPPDSTAIWTGTPGFGIADGSGSWGTGGEAGAQYAFLQSSNTVDNHQGSCQQTITGLKPHQKYKVTFWMARRNGDVGGNVGTPVVVSENSSVIFPATAPTSDGSWNSYQTMAFSPGSTACTFLFSTNPPPPNTDASTLLDEIHLVEVH